MRLNEQTKRRLKKLAGLTELEIKSPGPIDSKKTPPPPKFQQQPTGSIHYTCTSCNGCQEDQYGPFNSLGDCEDICPGGDIDTIFDDCPGPGCGGFNTKEEFCNRCEVEYEATQDWASQNNLPNCDCCEPGTEQIEMFACIDCEIQSIGMFDIDDPGLLFNDFNDSYYSYNYPPYNNIQYCEGLENPSGGAYWPILSYTTPLETACWN